MTRLQSAIASADTSTIKKLGTLSLLLVLGLTMHGLWILNHNARQMMESHQAQTVAAMGENTEMLLQMASFAVKSAESQLRAGADLPDAESAGGLTLPPVAVVNDTKFVVHFASAVPSKSLYGRLLTALTPNPMYALHTGMADINLGATQLAGSEPLYFVWKELSGAPAGVTRIGVPITAQMLRRFSLAMSSSGRNVPWLATLNFHSLALDHPAGGATVGVPEIIAAERAPDLIERKLTNIRATLQLRLSPVADDVLGLLATPMLLVVVLGSGMLVALLLLLMRAVSRLQTGSMELKDVKQLAQRVHLSKSGLQAALADELGTPLQGIISAARLLYSDVQRPDAHRLASTVLLSARALFSVVEKVRATALRTDDSDNAKRDVVNLFRLATEIVDLFYASATSKGLELTFSSPSAARYVTVDSAALRQVLANLVGNAVKFTTKGAVSLRCTLVDSCSKGRVQAHFEVVDTGIGMDKEQLQAVTTGTPINGSTYSVGLPLTIALVRQMGAELSIDSGRGRGTRISFRLDLPLAEVPQEEAPLTFSSTAPMRDERILLVEDNPVSAMVTQNQLRMLGYHSDVSPDGEAALAAMAAGGYDLVLMDCMLPGLSGQDVTKRWRAFEREHGSHPIPIVALTAKSMDSYIHQSLDAGMTDYLTKPCASETLEATLSKWLSASKRAP